MRVRLTYFRSMRNWNFVSVMTTPPTRWTPLHRPADAVRAVGQACRRVAAHQRASLSALQFPFPGYRPGQRAMIGAVYKICTEAAVALPGTHRHRKDDECAVPGVKGCGAGRPCLLPDGPRYDPCGSRERAGAAAASDAHLKLRSVTLTAKDKICMQDRRECTPEACPYAKGYYDRVRTALWDALDTHALTADALQMLARRHKVCPFELGLDLSLWCDVSSGLQLPV